MNLSIQSSPGRTPRVSVKQQLHANKAHSTQPIQTYLHFLYMYVCIVEKTNKGRLRSKSPNHCFPRHSLNPRARVGGRVSCLWTTEKFDGKVRKEGAEGKPAYNCTSTFIPLHPFVHAQHSRAHSDLHLFQSPLLPPRRSKSVS